MVWAGEHMAGSAAHTMTVPRVQGSMRISNVCESIHELPGLPCQVLATSIRRCLTQQADQVPHIWKIQLTNSASSHSPALAYCLTMHGAGQVCNGLGRVLSVWHN